MVNGLNLNHYRSIVAVFCRTTALSFDETKLYFISDMPGGKGGTDLYEAEIFEDDTYGAPVNLIAFNTIANEMFPFVDQDDTFYYSSNGLQNLGGLDVFYAKTNSNGVFESPQNIGVPINSTYDDFAFVIDKGLGYLASNRDNQNDQIYSFEQLKPLESLAKLNLSEQLSIAKRGPSCPMPKLYLLMDTLEEIGRVESDAQGRYDFDDTACGNITIVRASQSNYFANEVVVSGKDGGSINTTISLRLRRMAITDTGSKTDLGLLLDPMIF